MMQEKYPTRQNNQNNPYVSSGASFASQYLGGGIALMKAWYPEVQTARSLNSQRSRWDDLDLQRSRVWPDSKKSSLPEVQDNFWFDEF